ncbi:SHOCT domain-containing protein [Clostridium algoriphilum]|uniref:SHOCT domain-containing protein n=1 Tax=Clostridium algoriphilum TaxID=198347 RepID=UPI001CF2A29E|nr:SHOCT domain-containing protein [Clostridium algoriphilum]MCB2295284.1 SHOCT domain-containing protein [Clostridium algoriphilum]
MMGYRYSMMGGWSWMMMIMPMIIIGIVVFTVFKVLQNNNVKDIGTKDNSLGILNERFARGEIDEDEYNRKKSVLLNSKKL